MREIDALRWGDWLISYQRHQWIDIRRRSSVTRRLNTTAHRAVARILTQATYTSASNGVEYDQAGNLLLDLLPAQREAILALQHERDRVLRDARQRVRPARLDAARAAFDSQVQAVLTRFQQTELAQFQANIAANLDAVVGSAPASVAGHVG